jgi:erythromycin esterase-like protein
VPESCRDHVVGLLRELRHRAPAAEGDAEAHFVAEQNALVLRNAEDYYRNMVRGGSVTWNIRDRHMAETLARLARHHGARSKAVVWEHNTHIGDARFTDMAQDDMVNVGQLVRESHGDEGVVLVGLGSHRGTVIAGDEWGEPARRMEVPPAQPESWEDVLHRAAPEDRLMIFDGPDSEGLMGEPRGHRAIGVVYRPELESYGNYVPTVLPGRYDAFLYLDRTEALRPLGVPPDEEKVPDTYPTGV